MKRKYGLFGLLAAALVAPVATYWLTRASWWASHIEDEGRAQAMGAAVVTASVLAVVIWFVLVVVSCIVSADGK